MNNGIFTFASPIHIIWVTNKSRWTGTCIVANAIHTEGIGSTWALLTLVDILRNKTHLVSNEVTHCTAAVVQDVDMNTAGSTTHLTPTAGVRVTPVASGALAVMSSLSIDALGKGSTSVDSFAFIHISTL